MTQETTRLDRAFAILDALEQPEPLSDRISIAFQSLEGFPLTGAPDSVREAFESFGMTFNDTMRRYPEGPSDAPPDFSDEDARKLSTELRQFAGLTRDEETQQILARLRDHGGVLPEDEINEARRHPAWFVPYLMQEWQSQIAKLQKLEDVEERLPEDQHSSVPFFSLHLFSEWHVPESVPVVLESLRLPGEGPFALFGDAVHEMLPRYLAQFLPDQLDQIDSIVRDSNTNLYVRWSAANSYSYLVRDQVISIDDAVSRLDRLFDETKVLADDGSPGLGHPYELSAAILSTIGDIGGASRSTVLADSQERRFVDESILDLDVDIEVSDTAGDWEPTEALLRLPRTRMQDSVEEIRHWAAFRLTPKRTTPAPASKRVRRARPPVSRPPVPRASAPGPSLESVQSTKRVARVPRNAKCPCGSGKKYKQCCLRKET